MATPRVIPWTQQKRAHELRNNATPAERKLWSLLRASQLNGFKFSRQIAIGPYIADLVCRRERLVIEVDGSQHTPERDGGRDAFLRAQGYRVVHVTNEQVLKHADMVIGLIRQELLAGHSHPRPLPQAGGEQE